MRNVDFTPLYRSSVGFDRLSQMLDSAIHLEQSQPSYPPYNIERINDNEYRISMAVAGFSDSEVDIVVERGNLTVKGKKSEEAEKKSFLHKGIAARSFERKFQLADHVNVVSAALENGLLHIDLVREIPEAMKPKKISINSGVTKVKQAA